MWIRLAAVGIVGAGIGVLAAWFAFQPEARPPVDTRPVADEAVAPESPTAAPPISLSDIAAIAKDFDRNTALYAHLADADLERVRELIAWTDTLPSTRHRYDLKHVLYVRYAAIDPEMAIDHMLRGAYRDSWLAAVFRAWAHIDLDAAVGRARGLDASAKAVAARTILELELSDRERMAIAQQLGGERALAVLETRESLAEGESDFHSTWEEALGESDPRLRLERLGRIAASWAKEDPVAALDAAATTRGQLGMAIQSAIITIWATDDPTGAVNWLSQQESSTNLRFLSAALMRALAQNGVGDAISRLDSMPDHVRGYAVQGFVQMLPSLDMELSDADIDTVLDWYSTLEPQRDLAMMLSFTLAQRDPERALAWAQSLTGEMRATAIRGVISGLGTNDRELARRMVSEMDDADRLEAAKSLLYGDVRSNPREALAWAQSFDSESERVELVKTVFQSWTRESPDDAIDELLELPSGPERDDIVRSVAISTLPDRPDQAERLFEALETPEARRMVAGMLSAYFSRTVPPDTDKAEFYREAMEAAFR